jgi:large subunit ribosomal protein L22
MQVTSTYKYARISAFKAREVTREIQGHSASAALDLLTFSPKKAALLVKKTLKSAIANAENNAELRVDTLLVKEAVVGEGPTFKRFRARARGSASPLRKRTSHIRIVLTDELVPEAPAKRAKKRQTGRAGGATQAQRAKRDSGTVPVVGQTSSRESAPTKVDEPTGSSEPISEATPTAEKE